MKRLLATILAICCILSIVGCEVPDQSYELPNQFCYTADKLKTVEVSTNAQQRIIDILNSASWEDGHSDYEADYIFYTQNHQIEYNSENGVFFDVTSKKTVTLPEDKHELVNIILGVKNIGYGVPTRTIWKSRYYLGEGVTLDDNGITAVIPELDNATVKCGDSIYSKVFINDEELISGCHSFYVADITGDGKYEICLSLSYGSGVASQRIVIYDFETMQCIYELDDDAGYNYELNFRNEKMYVNVKKFGSVDPVIKTGVILYDGSEFFIRWDSYLPKATEQ